MPDKTEIKEEEDCEHNSYVVVDCGTEEITALCTDCDTNFYWVRD